MTVIHVPRPPKEVMNPNRPASALLLNQVEHMHVAEKRLPPRYRTEIYVNAIRTEGEAARYVSEVTKAIHQAHADAARQRTAGKSKQSRSLQLAAAADEPERQAAATTKARKATPKKKPKR